MNPRSLIPVGRERDVARLSEPFATLQREIDRLFNDFRMRVRRASQRPEGLPLTFWAVAPTKAVVCASVRSPK